MEDGTAGTDVGGCCCCCLPPAAAVDDDEVVAAAVAGVGPRLSPTVAAAEAGTLRTFGKE